MFVRRVVTRIAGDRAEKRLCAVSCAVLVVVELQHGVVFDNVGYVVRLEFLCCRVVFPNGKVLRKVERDIVIAVAVIVALDSREYAVEHVSVIEINRTLLDIPQKAPEPSVNVVLSGKLYRERTVVNLDNKLLFTVERGCHAAVLTFETAPRYTVRRIVVVELGKHSLLGFFIAVDLVHVSFKVAHILHTRRAVLVACKVVACKVVVFEFL